MIELTLRDILNAGAWDEYCETYGVNVWCLNEGLADGDELANITLEEARAWGILEAEND